jgi:iron complex outermembrane receptor protein
LTVKALYGGAFRAPSLDETGLNHPGLKGNPALVPEKIGTLDLLVSYQGNRAQWSAGYFHSRQTQRIIQDASTLPGHFYNLATAGTLQGFEGETKYYIRKEWFLTGSILYQTNEDGTGRKNVPPIPPFGAKAGISYLGANGAAVSLFDSYEGHVSGYAGALNPRPSAYHSVNAHLRFDFSKRWLANSRNGFALFVHGNNLAGRAVWLPAWGVPFPDTLPFNQGRTIYFGIEAWARRN